MMRLNTSHGRHAKCSTRCGSPLGDVLLHSRCHERKWLLSLLLQSMSLDTSSSLLQTFDSVGSMQGLMVPLLALSQ